MLSGGFKYLSVPLQSPLVSIVSARFIINTALPEYIHVMVSPNQVLKVGLSLETSNCNS